MGLLCHYGSRRRTAGSTAGPVPVPLRRVGRARAHDPPTPGRRAPGRDGAESPRSSIHAREEKHPIGNVQKAQIALDGVDRHTKLPCDLRVREQLAGASGEEVLSKGELVQVLNTPEVREVPFEIRSSEVA
jgi:hypothetical protein